jgi:hypothetical protein
MDNNRVINIILTELSVENLKLQEKLEQQINSNNDIEKKVFSIKDTLRSITLNELMINKFQALIPNNNNLNQNENG